MPNTRYPPSFRAKDNFKILYHGTRSGRDVTSSLCLWKQRNAASYKPDPYKYSEDRLGREKRAEYNKVFGQLVATFKSKEVPFVLKGVSAKGLGVFASRNIGSKELLSGSLSLALSGVASRTISAEKQSHSSICVSKKKKKMGRPAKGSGPPKAAAIQVKKSLVGPLSFLNHACEECAAMRIREKETEEGLIFYGQLLKDEYNEYKKIKKGDEILLFYNFDEADEDRLPCAKCGKR